MLRVVVSSGSTIAAEAGAEVADRGGNAVDAAVASTVAAMTTDPGIIAPGASAFITIWPPGGDPLVIDGYAEMPGRGLPDGAVSGFGDEVYMAYGGGMTTLIGHSSVATPGAFAGLGEASARYGALDWPAVLAPAIRLTDEGFPLSPPAAAYLAYAAEPIFDRFPESFAALHHADGSLIGEGDIVRIEGLAASLRTLAAEGPASLYTGSIGDRLAEDMAASGGRVTAEDLAAYRPIVREPIVVAADDWRVATNPAPAIGGATLAAMLQLVENRPFRFWDEDEVRRLAEVQRAVLGYRARHLDDADDRVAAVAELLDAARMGDHRRLLASPSTVHTSAVDSEGRACAITASAGYGSGVMISGTGLWLNNSLGEVELVPHGLDRIPVGSRLPSNMAPTVARRDDGSVLAIGSPGASRITTALAQVLLNFIHLGMSLSEAVNHPRLHVEVFEGEPTVAFEPGMPVGDLEGLQHRRFPDLSMYFGGVGVAMWDPVAGLFGAADPRRSGAVVTGGHS
jgi:gamma-glutamyltranspeptidase/glutathione hydrolase